MRAPRFLADALTDWNRFEASRLSAALAFYSVLSVAPLLVVAIAIAGAVLGEAAVRGEVSAQLHSLIGPQGAVAVQTMVESSSRSLKEGIFASVASIAMLIFGASSVVGELRSSLNKIWEIPEEGSLRAFAVDKGYALALVLAAGFLLLVSMLASAAISFTIKMVSGPIAVIPFGAQVLDFVFSVTISTFIFSLLFHGLPSVRPPWRAVLPGALITALLFSLGKYLIGLYLGRASLGSAYGAAGSLVIFLLWTYYAAQIFFAGAILTKGIERAFGVSAVPQFDDSTTILLS